MIETGRSTPRAWGTGGTTALPPGSQRPRCEQRLGVGSVCRTGGHGQAENLQRFGADAAASMTTTTLFLPFLLGGAFSARWSRARLFWLLCFSTFPARGRPIAAGGRDGKDQKPSKKSEEASRQEADVGQCIKLPKLPRGAHRVGENGRRKNDGPSKYDQRTTDFTHDLSFLLGIPG